MIVQHRHQYFSMKLVFQGTPVNIEKAGVGRSLAILENIEPPRIVTAHHSHVIGHDVENQSHVVFMESGHKTVEVLDASDLWIQRAVIHDVISVHASGTSLQARRNVAVTDAKRGKVGNYLLGLIESKVAVELQAIGGTWEFEFWLHDSRNHSTDHAGRVPRFGASEFVSSLA